MKIERIGIGKAFTGAFVASIALVVALIATHESPRIRDRGEFRVGSATVGIYDSLAHDDVVRGLPDYGTMGTFHTENLVVDSTETVGPAASASGHVVVNGDVTVETGAGQAALFSTKRAASTEGFNVCIGGGCQSVVYDGANTQTGSRNVALGIDALSAVTTGYQNVAVGPRAMVTTTTGHDNVALGQRAMEANTTGFESVAVGQDALRAQTGGSSNVAVGGTALQSLTTAGNNTALGTTAMQNLVTGDDNTAIGDQALSHSTNTTRNVAVGANALTGLTTGFQNTSVGYNSDVVDSTGIANTSVGAFATQLETGGVGNTCIGASVAPNLTTGQYNTIVGGLGGGGITTGSKNTIIGANITGLAGALSNNIAVSDGDGVIRWKCDSAGLTSIPGTLQVGGVAQTAGNVITSVGAAQQLTLQNTNAGTAAEFRFASSGNTIWDISPVPVNGTDAQTVRFFRRTTTSGAVGIQIDVPNSASSVAFISASSTALSGTSFFSTPVEFGASTGAVQYPITVVQNSGTGQTTSNRIASFDTIGAGGYSFNTTAGAITTYGIYVNDNAPRSAGANNVTNIGVYGNAINGQVNYSGVFDTGDVVTKEHIIGNGTATTVSACGGAGLAQTGDDKSGTITEGAAAAGCTITFATAYTTIIPSCNVTSQAGLGFTYTVSLTALTIVNVGALAGTTIDYNCSGHRAPGAI